MIEELERAALEHPLAAGVLRRAADEIRRLEAVVMGRRSVHQEMYGRNNSAPFRSAGPAEVN